MAGLFARLKSDLAGDDAVNHPATTDNDRNTDQNGKQERHDQSPSVFLRARAYNRYPALAFPPREEKAPYLQRVRR